MHQWKEHLMPIGIVTNNNQQEKVTNDAQKWFQFL